VTATCLNRAMAISDALLPEFDNEMANTRKTLERVPEGKFDWKPHAKSATMGRLATHVAMLPGWAVMTMQAGSFDVGTPEAAAVPASRNPLELFDKNVAEARAAITAAKDEQFLEPWSLLNSGQTIFTMPKVAVLRNFVMNHMIHHRAQLGVYLRLNDIPVPSIYGPSADEGQM
jgi:uncharacterized damage-inducible protein DinB